MHFHYKAKQGPKKIVEGSVNADTVDQAVSKILNMGFSPLDVKPAAQKDLAKKHKSKSIKKGFFKRVPFSALVIFTRQLSDLIDASVPMLRTLDILKKQIKQPILKEVIQEMYLHVQDGGTLSSALSLSPGVFSPLFVNMVRSGEVGGNLSSVLERLADFMEKEQQWRSQVITSLIYPSLILIVGIVTIFVLLTWVVPRITDIFVDFSASLPWPTFILMKLSDFFARFWWVMLLLSAAGIFYFKRFVHTAPGRLWLDNIKLKLPLFGPFLRDAEIGRFARTLATLMENGVVVVPALEAVSAVMENEVIRGHAQKITQEVTDGASLTYAVKGSELFGEAVENMIAVGEETGQLHKGLHKLADYYERQTQRFIKRVTSLIEPLLILGIGLIVGFMVIAMLLPILQMNLMIQ